MSTDPTTRLLSALVTDLMALAATNRKARLNLRGDNIEWADELLSDVIDNADDYAEALAGCLTSAGQPLATGTPTLPPLGGGYRSAEESTAEMQRQVQHILDNTQAARGQIDDPTTTEVLDAVIAGLANDRWWLFGRVF